MNVWHCHFQFDRYLFHTKHPTTLHNPRHVEKQTKGEIGKKREKKNREKTMFIALDTHGAVTETGASFQYRYKLWIMGYSSIVFKCQLNCVSYEDMLLSRDYIGLSSRMDIVSHYSISFVNVFNEGELCHQLSNSVKIP